jgi:hypothetical protein
MPDKNILFTVIEQLKNLQQAGEGSPLWLNTAEKKFYQQSVPYYLLVLPQTEARLDYAEKLDVIEHHASVFEMHETSYRTSNWHYKAILGRAGDEARYQLRVFFNGTGEPTGDVSWYRLNADGREELLPLKAKQIDTMIEFAQIQTTTLLHAIYQERTQLCVRKKEQYQERWAAYLHLVDSSVMALEQHKEVLEQALLPIEVLSNVGARTYYRQKYYLISNLIKSIHFPVITPDVALDVPPDVTGDDTDLTASKAVMPVQSNMASTSSVLVTHKPDFRDAWVTLQKSVVALCTSQEVIPTALQGGGVNVAYFDYVQELEARYRALYADYFVLEEAAGSSCGVEQRNFVIAFEKAGETQAALGKKCLELILMFASKIPDFEARRDQLQAYTHAVDIKLFCNVIHQDLPDLLLFLLEARDVAWHAIMLPVKPSDANLFQGVREKPMLEEMIMKGSSKCLLALAKRQRINFLLPSTQGVPLASLVLQRPLTDDFRLACVSDIPVFSSEAFYLKLMEVLRSEDHRHDTHIEHAETAHLMYKRLPGMQAHYAQQRALLSHLPDAVKTAMNLLSDRMREENQLKFLHVQQLVQEVNQKVEQFTQNSPVFRRNMREAMGDFFSRLDAAGTGDEPLRVVTLIQEMDAADVENALDMMIQYCHELNEFLYFSLPESRDNPDNLSRATRESLRQYHLGRLRSFAIMTTDPVETIREEMNFIATSMKRIQTANEAHRAALMQVDAIRRAGGCPTEAQMMLVCRTFEKMGEVLDEVKQDPRAALIQDDDVTPNALENGVASASVPRLGLGSS